jgi:hypothetical protein
MLEAFMEHLSIENIYRICTSNNKIVTWWLKAGIVDPEKISIARQHQVNTFPQQPKHSLTS